MLEQDEKKESGYWVTGTEKPMQRGREANSADTPAGSMILRPTERVAFSHVLYFFFGLSWVRRSLMDMVEKGIPKTRQTCCSVP